MRNKIMLSTILIILFSILLCGCDGVYEEKTFNKTSDYDKIYDLYDNRSNFYIFPENIDDTKVTSFNCNWKSFDFVGASFEVILKTEYDKTSYSEEVKRLSNLSDKQRIKYDTEHFVLPAYVATIGYHSTNEYALLSEDTLCITYIYTQILNVDEMKYVDKTDLPIGYKELGDVEGIRFSMYYNTDDQYGW